jgi:hypothetical protein
MTRRQVREYRGHIEELIEEAIVKDPSTSLEDVVLITAIEHKLPEVLVFEPRSWLWQRARRADKSACSFLLCQILLSIE